MKTKKLFLQLCLAFLAVSLHSKAQWSMVRFDEYNTYQKVFAADANAAFVIGTEPMNNDYFILRTNDNGTTWDSLSINAAGSSYSLNTLYFTDAATGFTGGRKNNNQVLLKTTDNGNTWNNVTPDTNSADFINSIYFIDSQTGFATTGAALYGTVNGGVSWSQTSTSFSIEDLHFFDPNTGFASGTNAANEAVIMKTSDAGNNWVPSLNITLPVFINTFPKLDVISSTILFTSAQYFNKLFRTSNAGAAWDTITVSQISEIVDFDFVTENKGHVLSSLGEIYSTQDGGNNWTLEYSANWGIYGPSEFLNSISFFNNEPAGYVAGYPGLIKKYIFTTGIKESVNANEINIYPNPSTGRFQIINHGAEVTNIEIYNAVGDLILKPEIKREINLSSQPPGIYFIKLHTDKSLETKKVIISR